MERTISSRRRWRTITTILILILGVASLAPGQPIPAAAANSVLAFACVGDDVRFNVDLTFGEVSSSR
jgi:hypothetical protein